MNIVISGSSGFIGKELCTYLESRGHEIIHLRRKDFRWPIHEFKEKLRETDVLINLAGSPILKRWTPMNKREIRDSRINTTNKILTAFKLLKDRPRLFIAASAIGIYASGGQHNEDSHDFGSGFLYQLASDWEREILKAKELANLRLVIFRLGVVLGNSGGAFPRMLRIFKLGLGARLGKGNQALSFIHIDDLIEAFGFAIDNQQLKGIYNLTAPNPTSNREFTKVLASALKRPAFWVIPGFILKLIFGKAATVLLDSQNVVPTRLQQAGFRFRFQTIKDAIFSLTGD
jgi:uncharacterized protein (TIGR01777 family)